jgi:transcriptional regulator with XRE-family HTH domain
MDAMSPDWRRTNELGDFLKARRAQLTPHEVGLPEAGTHRKITGLRREEVPQLAAISVDYLTRLEQGRVQASASVLSTLCRALRLDDDQQTYLYQLAGKAPRPRRRPAQKARPAMRRLLDQLTQTPAIVLGRRLDILAWNASATALYTDFARIPARRRNYVRLLFTDPVFRGLHAEWRRDARIVVASLRMEAANDPDDPVSPSWSASCRCRMPTSAAGGPAIRSPGPATAPSTTGTRSSVTSPSTATPGTAPTTAASASWSSAPNPARPPASGCASSPPGTPNRSDRQRPGDRRVTSGPRSSDRYPSSIDLPRSQPSR